MVDGMCGYEMDGDLGCVYIIKIKQWLYIA